MKWKWRSDRRSERNLCNCVKKPEKNLIPREHMNPQYWPAPNVSGFTAQLVEHRIGNREVTGSNPVEVLNFFQASLSNCKNCVHCDHHFFIFENYIHVKMLLTKVYSAVHYIVTLNILDLLMKLPHLFCKQKKMTIGLLVVCWHTSFLNKSKRKGKGKEKNYRLEREKKGKTYRNNVIIYSELLNNWFPWISRIFVYQML